MSDGEWYKLVKKVNFLKYMVIWEAWMLLCVDCVLWCVWCLIITFNQQRREECWIQKLHRNIHSEEKGNFILDQAVSTGSLCRNKRWFKDEVSCYGFCCVKLSLILEKRSELRQAVFLLVHFFEKWLQLRVLENHEDCMCKETLILWMWQGLVLQVLGSIGSVCIC